MNNNNQVGSFNDKGVSHYIKWGLVLFFGLITGLSLAIVGQVASDLLLLTGGLFAYAFGERFIRNYAQATASVPTQVITPESEKVIADLEEKVEELEEILVNEAPIVPEKSKRKTYWDMSPQEAEIEYLGYFGDKILEAQDQVELTKNMPEDVKKDARDILSNAKHSLKVAETMVEAIKNPRIVKTPEGANWAIPQPDSIGPVGFRIAGIPEAQLPGWVVAWLKANP